MMQVDNSNESLQLRIHKLEFELRNQRAVYEQRVSQISLKYEELKAKYNQLKEQYRELLNNITEFGGAQYSKLLAHLRNEIACLSTGNNREAASLRDQLDAMARRLLTFCGNIDGKDHPASLYSPDTLRKASSRKSELLF